MATSTEEPTRQSPWQRRIVLLAAVLFPLLVAGGVVAPQVISVMAEEQLDAKDAEEETPVLDFSEPLPGKPPIPLPRDYNMGFVPELLDLQNLFRRSEFSSDPISRQFARLLSFPRNHGDVIIMDDVDTAIRSVLFDDPVMVGAVTGEIGPPDPDLLALGDPVPHGDGVRYDDPQGTGEGDTTNIVPIPEPNTAFLLMAGLAAVSIRRRYPI